MKKNVKATVSFFWLLIEHSQKEYEPSPEHILKRKLLPLCRNFSEIAKEGTKNDAWDVIEGFSQQCGRSLR
ncbi:MAG: hypothetical protein QHJ81_09585 [Anaerolineae bacterium]|nr:hypothetical protein [Anaerolineae bacterium]